MILTLPISHLITKDNYLEIQNIAALEYKNTQSFNNSTLTKLFHSGKGIIQKDFINYFHSIKKFLQENNVTLFSFDLGPAAEYVDINDYYYIALSKVLSKNEIKERIHSNLNLIKQEFEGDIALENLNYFPTSAYDFVCDPEFINEIIIDNNVYLLLDIAHAVISAHNLDIEIMQYFKLLPLGRVREIHLSHPGIINRQWRDLHEKPGKEEYQILDSIIQYLPEKIYILIEYYKNFSKLVDTYKYLSKKLSTLKLLNT